MRIATVSLESVSPLSMSKYIRTPRNEKETHDDHDRRTWRERCHADDDGYVVIPGVFFKEALSNVAKYLSVKIPGKLNATYTKNFVSGILISDHIRLPVKVEDVESETIPCSANGIHGGSKRVFKTFPVVRKWEGNLTVHILDDTITEDIFAYHLQQAGAFIGIGKSRVQRGYYYGRFKVLDIKWENVGM